MIALAGFLVENKSEGAVKCDWLLHILQVIGEGALRMIVLNPERGSKELGALANAIKSNENIEKYAAATSLAALFVWHPADTNKPTIRILYPGWSPALFSFLWGLFWSLVDINFRDFAKMLVSVTDAASITCRNVRFEEITTDNLSKNMQLVRKSVKLEGFSGKSGGYWCKILK